MILADKTNIEMMEALVAEFAKWKGNAKLMANYPLLAKTNGNGENTFYNYYMLDTLNSSKESYAMLKKGGDVKSFSGLTYYTYNVQKIPLLTVAYMIELNNKIAAGAPCSKHKYEADKAEYFAREVAEPYFNRDLGNGRDDSATIDAIKGAAEGFSGLDEIKEAMYKEFDLFKKQCK